VLLTAVLAPSALHLLARDAARIVTEREIDPLRTYLGDVLRSWPRGLASALAAPLLVAVAVGSWVAYRSDLPLLAGVGCVAFVVLGAISVHLGYAGVAEPRPVSALVLAVRNTVRSPVRSMVLFMVGAAWLMLPAVIPSQVMIVWLSIAASAPALAWTALGRQVARSEPEHGEGPPA
jgi:hypothetical protein